VGKPAHRDEDDFRQAFAQLARHSVAIHFGHRDIDQGHVGRMLEGRLDAGRLTLFRPALRRPEHLSSSARCASSGDELTPDDGRFAFDANLPEFDASVLGEKKILAQMDVGTSGANFPQDYDMPLGWPKPSWGKWELRDSFVLDIRKIPSKASGYCYGKRIMYVDKQFYGALWQDLYDAKMQPWKIALLQPIVLKVPRIGPQNSTGAQYSHYWDIQNNHATYNGPNDGRGYDVLINDDVPKSWDDIAKYSNPSGLDQVMR